MHGEPRQKPKISRNKRGSTGQPRLVPGFNNGPYDCFRPTPLDHHNRGLVERLSRLGHHRFLTGNAQSELAYSRAVAILRAYPRDLLSVEEARQLHGIGPKIAGLIGEYMASGTIQEAEACLEGEDLRTLELFAGIHGVGPKTAARWHRLGLRTLADLTAAAASGRIKLQPAQELGIQHYDDLARPMTRAETEEILAVVRAAAHRAFGGAVVADLAGGYRRGKALNSDADILLHPLAEGAGKAGLLDRLVAQATEEGCIKAVLASPQPLPPAQAAAGLDICSVCFQVRPAAPVRRVDLIVAAGRSYAFAQLGWTGSRQFERSLRLYAQKEHGLTLTDHSLGRAGAAECMRLRKYKAAESTKLVHFVLYIIVRLYHMHDTCELFIGYTSRS